MKKEIKQDMKAFYSNPEDWIKEAREQLYDYMKCSTNPYKTYVSSIFDKVFEKYESTKDDPLAEVLLQNVLADFLMIKTMSKQKELDLDQILFFLNPTDTSIFLLEQAKILPDCEYWKTLGEAYTGKEFVHVPSDILRMLFNQPKGSSKCLMNEEERSILEGLPNKIKVYRAMSRKEEKSMNYRISWTLNEDVAYDFVERQSLFFDIPDSFVKKQEVQKSNIIAYFNRRSEDEVIILFD